MSEPRSALEALDKIDSILVMLEEPRTAGERALLYVLLKFWADGIRAEIAGERVST